MITEKAHISLRVSEANTKDLGRPIVRMDPQDMQGLGIVPGDWVLIEGERKTPAKVMPCFSEERGKHIIQMDGIMRENAQIQLEQKVNIYPTELKAARKVSLQPMGRLLSSGMDSRYVRSLLEGMPLVQDNILRAKLLGTGKCDFRVLQTEPQGFVFINQQTQLQLKLDKKSQTQKKRDKISYEDIGGLREQVQRVREMIELPLKYPDVFLSLGIDPPKGVLLSGPPGTGKTLIARAVANETNVYFFSISGPEIMGKLYGESESRLRKVFEDARKNAPSIIFLDEIDSIAPKRENMGEEKQVERRVVAQLLALLDGLESRGQVIVIAATNLPDMIDPALRRPGRFDREISVPIPDKHGRLEILNVHTQGMPLGKDVALENLAAITHGYVGADLEALAREAAMTKLRKLIPLINFEEAAIPFETLEKLEIEMDDFHEAMKGIEPSAIREVFVEVPDVKWEEVGGLEKIKEEIREAIEWPLKYGELFEQADTRPSKGILLYGPPGTGKTLLAKAAASQTGVNFISVKGPALISRFIGESERAIRDIFRKAKQAAPTILFFDEIDAITPKRSSGSGGSHVAERVISQFLTEMDGVEELRDVVVLGATNRIDMMDDAILRSGRFDLQMEVPPPDAQTRLEIFIIHTRNKPLSKEVDLAAISQRCHQYVGADIEFVCRKAALFAIRDFIKQGQSEEFSIRQRHFEAAVDLVEAKKSPSNGKAIPLFGNTNGKKE